MIGETLLGCLLISGWLWASHLACLFAGTFVGSFMMAVWQDERRYREASELHREMFNRGRWFPPATQPPPPAPPAPPAPCSRPPETR